MIVQTSKMFFQSSLEISLFELLEIDYSLWSINIISLILFLMVNILL